MNRDRLRRILLYAVEAKETLWHGTSTAFAKDILSQGFVPEPKKKTWSPDTGDRASFEGTYFTPNWMTAYSAAGSTIRKFGGERVIFEVQIETRTSLMDEDNLPRADESLKSGNRLGGLMSSLLKGYLDDPEALAEFVDRGSDGFRKSLELFFQPLSDRQWASVKPAVLEYLKAAVVAGAALQGPRSYDSVEYGEERHMTPEVRNARSQVMSKLKGLVSRTKEGETFHINLRIDEPVGFGGANRILSAVEILEPKGGSSSETDPRRLHALYGTVSDEFLKEFDKSIGGHRVVEK